MDGVRGVPLLACAFETFVNWWFWGTTTNSHKPSAEKKDKVAKLKSSRSKRGMYSECKKPKTENCRKQQARHEQWRQGFKSFRATNRSIKLHPVGQMHLVTVYAASKHVVHYDITHFRPTGVPERTRRHVTTVSATKIVFLPTEKLEFSVLDL